MFSTTKRERSERERYDSPTTRGDSKPRIWRSQLQPRRKRKDQDASDERMIISEGRGLKGDQARQTGDKSGMGVAPRCDLQKPKRRPLLVAEDANEGKRPQDGRVSRQPAIQHHGMRQERKLQVTIQLIPVMNHAKAPELAVHSLPSSGPTVCRLFFPPPARTRWS